MDEPESDGLTVRNAALVSMVIMLVWLGSQMDPGPLWVILAGLAIFGFFHIIYLLIAAVYCWRNRKSRNVTGIVILVLYWTLFIPYMIKAPAMAGSDAQGALIYFFGPLYANVIITVLLGGYFLVRYCIQKCRNGKTSEE